MAAGEYGSASSQAGTEEADMTRERRELDGIDRCYAERADGIGPRIAPGDEWYSKQRRGQAQLVIDQLDQLSLRRRTRASLLQELEER